MIRAIGITTIVIFCLCVGAVFGSISQANHIAHDCDNLKAPETIIAGHKYFCADYDLLMKAIADKQKESNV